MKLWQKFSIPALFVGVLVGRRPRAGACPGRHSIKIDGSSTVFPISEALAEEFQISKRGKVHVTVGIAGTGGGFKKFCRGETDISDASRPILAEEMEACRKAGISYMELPIAFDALTVVINPANSWVKSMTVAELKKIWDPGAQGRVNNWNQVRSGFPSREAHAVRARHGLRHLRLLHRGRERQGEVEPRRLHGQRGRQHAGAGRRERARAGSGYFGFAYYAAHKDKLRAVAIDGGKGPVEPSAENVINGTYQPLSRPLFMYVKVSAASRPEVQEFIKFCLTKGAAVRVGSRLRAAAGIRLSDRAAALQRAQDGHGVRRSARRWASRSTSCSRWSAKSNHSPRDSGRGGAGSGPPRVHGKVARPRQPLDCRRRAGTEREGWFHHAPFDSARIARARSRRSPTARPATGSSSSCCCSPGWSRCSRPRRSCFILLYESAGFFEHVTIREFLTDTMWTPLFADAHYGIMPLVAGTLTVTGVALLVAIPLGTIIAIYLSEFAPHQLRETVKPILELLGAVPTVVYGYFALLIVTPLLQKVIPGAAGLQHAERRTRDRDHDRPVRRLGRRGRDAGRAALHARGLLRDGRHQDPDRARGSWCPAPSPDSRPRTSSASRARSARPWWSRSRPACSPT